MNELGLVPLVNGAHTRLMNSALPHSPQVVDRPPGRLRVLTASLLHRLAARLDRGLLTEAGEFRTTRPAACAR